MTTRALHPSERFVAPSTILTGTPLKEVIGPKLVALLAESFAAVAPKFNGRRFRAAATSGLNELELTERAEHIARALAVELPADFDDAAPLLIAALGPELTATEGNGLAPFFYLPHSAYVATEGVEHFDSGMRACYELTKRFSAEFCIRPLLVRHKSKALRLLLRWTRDASPHVRRLVSEGTRPRLPWASRLRNFQQDPALTLALLERLKDDPELYVRRSVANHLADVLKDHPDFAFAVCERWLKETAGRRFDRQRTAARCWIVSHAVRLPAKKENARAQELCARARSSATAGLSSSAGKLKRPN